MPFVLLYLVVEIVALVALGSVIGLAWTLAVLLAGSVLGFWLARREGLRAAQALGRAVSERRVAHQELTDGMLVAAGGVLLFVPGLVTDVAGLLLLFPPTRSLVRARLVRAAEERAPELRTARLRSAGPVVEGGVVDGTVYGTVYGTVDGTVVSDIGSDDISARPARPARSPEDGPLVIEGSVLPEERRSA